MTKKRVKNIYNSIDEIKKSKKYNIKKFSILFLKKSEFSKKVIFGCRTISQFKNIEKIINSKHQMTDEEFSNVKKDYLKKIKNKKLY